MDKVLVLNSDFTPLNVTTLRRGFILVQKGRAEVLKKGDDIVTTIGNFVRPVIIRLLNFVRFRPHNLSVSRKRIFKRDNYECGYCGSKKNLTIDHVQPKSRGGLNTWNNLITCCSRCNSIKGDKTPDEANMKLRFKPTVPGLFSKVIDDNVEKIWNEFDYSLSW